MRISNWTSYLLASAIAASMFGFQLIGALADSIGMDAPRPLSFALRIGVGVLLVILLIKRRLRMRPNLAGAGFFIGVLFLSFYGSHLLLKTQFPQFELRLAWYEYSGYLLLFVLIPFIGSSTAVVAGFFAKLFNVLIVVTVGILAIYLSAYGADAFRGMRYHPFQSVNPIGIGYTGLIAATLIAWLLFIRRVEIISWMFALPILLSGITLALLSGQRQVFLSLAMTGLLFLYLLDGKNLFARFLKRAFFVFFMLVAVLGITELEGIEIIFDRLTGTAERIGAGDEGRLLLWTEAIEVLLRNPILGGPIELPSNGYYPHNLPLEAFMATGMIGGTLFLAFFSLILLLSLKVIKSRELGWVAILHLQIALSALFSGAIYSNDWYWTTAGLVIASYHTFQRNLRSQPVTHRPDQGTLVRTSIQDPGLPQARP